MYVLWPNNYDKIQPRSLNQYSQYHWSSAVNVVPKNERPPLVIFPKVSMMMMMGVVVVVVVDVLKMKIGMDVDVW
jgi:hypothetical protein